MLYHVLYTVFVSDVVLAYVPSDNGWAKGKFVP